MRVVFILFFIIGYMHAAHANQSSIDGQIQTMIEKSLPQLACNMSIGAAGSVIASPERESPNYYFHWVRDSALIVQALTELLPFVANTPNELRIHSFIADFADFSKRLQMSGSPHGFGEVRFHPDGRLDFSDWPRPQYDGPALRALALIRYLDQFEARIASPLAQQVREIIRRDLVAVADLYDKTGFDLWEYSHGFHFYTRMVQAAALREGQLLLGPNPIWQKALTDLYSALERHWNSESQVIAFNDGYATDADGKPLKTYPVRYDTSVALAVNHANLFSPHFSAMDDRVWMTLGKLQNYFLDAFPLNAGKSIGGGIGRHKGDGYYGGNAFFFLTAAYAELSFRIAISASTQKGDLEANDNRIATLRRVLQSEVKRHSRIQLPNQQLAEAFASEGDAFLQTMLDVIPPDGSMAEQFSKVNGAPASAQRLSWSYASLLTAILQREKWQRSNVDYTKLDFRCLM